MTNLELRATMADLTEATPEAKAKLSWHAPACFPLSVSEETRFGSSAGPEGQHTTGVSIYWGS